MHSPRQLPASPVRQANGAVLDYVKKYRLRECGVRERLLGGNRFTVGRAAPTWLLQQIHPAQQLRIPRILPKVPEPGINLQVEQASVMLAVRALQPCKSPVAVIAGRVEIGDLVAHRVTPLLLGKCDGCLSLGTTPQGVERHGFTDVAGGYQR